MSQRLTEKVDGHGSSSPAAGTAGGGGEPLWEGDVFAGKYRVERIIGQGAMGMVLAARHLGLDEAVAIKVLLPEMRQIPGMVDRFVREARAAARIRGEHVVHVSDVDQLPNGLPYMVMERLEGTDFADLCQAHPQLRVGDAVRYVQQVAAALADAHAAGIVHRDIKPGNLFLVRRRGGAETVKVLDFGISKVQHGGHQETSAGALLGSPSYMSPEQMASSSSVDGRSDIWALGVVLYEFLTGEVPFTGDSLPALCTSIIHNQPPPMASLRPDVPQGLEAIVLRCLQKDRNDRFGSAAELSAALAPYAASGPGVTDAAAHAQTDRAPSFPGTDSAPGVRSGPALNATTLQSVSQSAPLVPARRGPAGLVMGIVAALAVAGVVAFVATRAPSGAGERGAPVAEAAGVPAEAARVPAAKAVDSPAESPAAAQPVVAPAASAPPGANESATAATSATAALSAAASASASASANPNASAAPRPAGAAAMATTSPRGGAAAFPSKPPATSAARSAAPGPSPAPGDRDPFQGERK